MEKNNKKNKSITLAAIGIIVLLIVLVGATYAYFSSTSNTSTQTIKTAKVDLLVEVDDEATHIENIKPTTWVSTDDAKTNMDIVEIPITVTNRSTIDINYDLFITPNGLTLNNSLDGDGQELQGGSLSDVKYKLYEVTDGNINTDAVIEDSLSNGDKRVKLITDKAIKAKIEDSTDNIQKYMLYIYIENKDEEQNKLQGIKFNIKIDGVTPPEKVAQTILANETPKEDQPSFTIDYTDKGLYVLNDSDAVAASTKSTTNKGRIYYYRGAVDNNYVQFGTYKKDVHNMIYDSDSTKAVDTVVAEEGNPILWRIVRINEDGSIKLIAENNIGDENTQYHVWDDINNKPDYVITNEDGSTTDSLIKQTVDTWYDETIGVDKKLDDLVINTKFCNDRSKDYGGVRERIFRSWKVETPPEPTLKCAQESDIVEAKAGLITADEMVYAGALVGAIIGKENNNITYLNNKTWFWTMSPNSSENAYNWESTELTMFIDITDFTTAARPVITISPEAIITKGDGTLDSPWIIE